MPDQSERIGDQMNHSGKNLHLDLQLSTNALPEVIVDDDDEDDIIDARIVYWAANLGNEKLVKDAIEIRNISPYINCFKDRSYLSGAIVGRQEKVTKRILSYRFTAKDTEDKNRMKEFLLEGDVDGNTPMHLAYSRSQPVVRDMLRKYEEDKDIEIRMREALNK
jgi:hypothetical protein